MELLDHVVSASGEPWTPKKANKMNSSDVDEENSDDPICCVENSNSPPMPGTPEKKNETKHAQNQSSYESYQEEQEENPSPVDDQTPYSSQIYQEGQEENPSPVDVQTRYQEDEENISQESCVVDPSPVDLCSEPILDKGIDPTTEKPKKKIRKKHRPKVLTELWEQNICKESAKKQNVKQGKQKEKEKVTREEPGKEHKRKYVRRKPLNTPPFDDCIRSMNSDIEYEAEVNFTKKPRFSEDAWEQWKKNADGNGVGVGTGEMLYPFPSPYAGFIEDNILSGARKSQLTRRELIKLNLHHLIMQRDYPELPDKNREATADKNREATATATAKKRMSVFEKIPRRPKSDSDKIQPSMPGSDKIQRLSKRSIAKNQRELLDNLHNVKEIEPLVDALTYYLERISLCDDENKALVLSNGDGKKKKKPPKPRPEVDLDSESVQEWNRLILNLKGKTKDDDQNTSEDKKNRWNEERESLWKKIKPLIIHMYNLQGDRRFSAWSGSVVDSIIGVFLTQNTTDVMSSSAFMSLKSHFPIKYDITTAEEPEVEFPDIEDSNSPKFSENISTSEENHKAKNVEWDDLRKQYEKEKSGRSRKTRDSADWEAVRNADVKEIADIIKERGMHNTLAQWIKDFLNRVVEEHGSIDLEWLRDVPAEDANKYLLSIKGIGVKSAQCIGLLTLLQHAFPVDTNIARIAVRLGWVPLRPLPGDMQFHDLELYPDIKNIQKYLWLRLRHLDHKILYEIHYQMITFGKVFCTKRFPNCNACPMKAECKHFASAYASAKLTGPEEQGVSVTSAVQPLATQNPTPGNNPLSRPPPKNINIVEITSEATVRVLASPEITFLDETITTDSIKPVVEIPASPECPDIEDDIGVQEDPDDMDPEESPILELSNIQNSASYTQAFSHTHDLQDNQVCKSLATLNRHIPSIPTPIPKNIYKLRTEHQVYVLPDLHPLLKNLPSRVVDEENNYLLAIWAPGETPDSNPIREKGHYASHNSSRASVSINTVEEANSGTVKGTLLIPSRTLNGGSFPLNGTYFQTNEVVADHYTSYNPIDVRRDLIWNLPKRTVYFGNSIPSIFRYQTAQKIQGYVCLRAVDRETGLPKPLVPRFHYNPQYNKKREE